MSLPSPAILSSQHCGCDYCRGKLCIQLLTSLRQVGARRKVVQGLCSLHEGEMLPTAFGSAESSCVHRNQDGPWAALGRGWQLFVKGLDKCAAWQRARALRKTVWMRASQPAESAWCSRPRGPKKAWLMSCSLDKAVAARPSCRLALVLQGR